MAYKNIKELQKQIRRLLVPSTDSVISGFAKAVNDLKTISEARQLDIEDHQTEITNRIELVKTASFEQARADRIAANITKLIEGI